MSSSVQPMAFKPSTSAWPVQPEPLPVGMEEIAAAYVESTSPTFSTPLASMAAFMAALLLSIACSFSVVVPISDNLPVYRVEHAVDVPDDRSGSRSDIVQRLSLFCLGKRLLRIIEYGTGWNKAVESKSKRPL